MPRAQVSQVLLVAMEQPRRGRSGGRAETAGIPDHVLRRDAWACLRVAGYTASRGRDSNWAYRKPLGEGETRKEGVNQWREEHHLRDWVGSDERLKAMVEAEGAVLLADPNPAEKPVMLPDADEAAPPSLGGGDAAIGAAAADYCSPEAEAIPAVILAVVPPAPVVVAAVLPPPAALPDDGGEAGGSPMQGPPAAAPVNDAANASQKAAQRRAAVVLAAVAKELLCRSQGNDPKPIGDTAKSLHVHFAAELDALIMCAGKANEAAAAAPAGERVGAAAAGGAEGGAAAAGEAEAKKGGRGKRGISTIVEPAKRLKALRRNGTSLLAAATRLSHVCDVTTLTLIIDSNPRGNRAEKNTFFQKAGFHLAISAGKGSFAAK